MVRIRPTMATLYWSAPAAKPIPIDKKIYVNSSGSFIGVLNLTIDSAPTSPKDNAKDDFTTAIIIVVPTLKIGNTFDNVSGLEKVLDCLRYTLAKIKDKTKDKTIAKTNELKEILDTLGVPIKLFKISLFN